MRKITNHKFKKITALLATSSLLFSLFGCVDNSPMEPEKSASMKRTTEQLTFFKAKTVSLKKVFSINQTISANGGTMQVGDDTTGYSSIMFPPGALSHDTNVTFDLNSLIFEANFGPHGEQFRRDVTIRLSYKDADLGSTDENDLRIWYYDEDNSIWELAGQIVNTQEKYVEGTTTHFSRYAIGAE